MARVYAQRKFTLAIQATRAYAQRKLTLALQAGNECNVKLAHVATVKVNKG